MALTLPTGAQDPLVEPDLLGLALVIALIVGVALGAVTGLAAMATHVVLLRRGTRSRIPSCLVATAVTAAALSRLSIDTFVSPWMVASLAATTFVSTWFFLPWLAGPRLRQ